MKKACKNCRMLVEGNECPLCKGTQFSTLWRGRIIVIDTSRSSIGKKLGIKANGEYAMKVG